MAGFRIEGNTSGNVLEVDANNNAKVNLPTTASQAGFASIQSMMDAGTITGSKLVRTPDVSDDSRLAVGVSTVLAQYNFNATTQNTGDWKHAFTTMTMTQSSGFLNINPALATVSGNYASLQTWRHFQLQGDGTIHVEFVGQISAMPPANQILEAGLFVQTAGVAPTDGVFFRLTSAGLIGVLTYGGTETTTGTMFASITPNTNAKFQITIGQRGVWFWVDGVLAAYQAIPAANATPFLTQCLPVTLHMRNSNTVTGGMTVKIGTLHVTQEDIATSKPWSAQKSLQGDAYQGQDGDTMGSLAAYSNAALGAAAALSNTATLLTGLGGVGLVLPTLTAGTDGIFCSYQNPAGSTSQPPKTLCVTGVRVDASVQVALTGGPLTLIVGAAFGHTAVSLATTETGSFVTATTKAPRRVPLGNLDFVVTAAAGTGAVGITVSFKSPIVVNPGEFFAITIRNVGTVTTAGALAVTAMVDHYFE